MRRLASMGPDFASRGPSKLWGWLAVVFLALLLLSGCGGSDDSSSGTAGAGGNVVVPPPVVPPVVNKVSLGGQVYVAVDTDERYIAGTQANVLVYNADGTKFLEQGQTDARGRLASLPVPEGPVVVQVSARGYVTQTIPLKASKGKGLEFQAVLLPVGSSQIVNNFENGGTFVGNDGASVVVAANSFLSVYGEPVSGSVQIDMTPYNAQARPEAFPGSAYVTQNGVPGMMVSQGMTEFSFSQSGKKLQLKPGATAKITIPLYATVNAGSGKPLVAGDTVPVWSMSDATGEWREEPSIVGKVVKLPSSPTGLGMEATVTHFTWWNCDYFRTIRSMTLKIYDDEGQLYSGPVQLSASFTEKNNGNYVYSSGGWTTLDVVNGVSTIDVPQAAVEGAFSVFFNDGLSADTQMVAQSDWVQTQVVVFHLKPQLLISADPYFRFGNSVDGKYFVVDLDDVTHPPIHFFALKHRVPSLQVEWLVNDVVGGNASVGTISPDGVYEPPEKFEGVSVGLQDGPFDSLSVKITARRVGVPNEKADATLYMSKCREGVEDCRFPPYPGATAH